jgi:predicted MPP superfamily phosphohydrolase
MARAQTIGIALATGAGRWALRLGLPLLTLTAVLHTFPYRTTVEGVPLTFQGSVFSRPGLSADTSVGNWEFPDVSGLPLGVHVRLENINLLSVSTAAAKDPSAYAEALRQDVADKLPTIAAWFIVETIVAIVAGLLVAAAINLALRYLRGLERRPDELKYRLRQGAAAGLVAVLVAGFGVLTYNGDWVRRSRLTGTLAAAELFPDQLASYYHRGSKVYDVLGSIAGIQAALQDRIEADQTPETAVRIMFISDMHLGDTYPLVARYAESYDVDLIINTGDESEFGTTAEITPTYRAALESVTRIAPMLWVAGNHDSPSVVGLMRSLPGVTVLGTKERTIGGYTVTAQSVRAFGLSIAGLPDPRVYGGTPPFDSNDPGVTDGLQRDAVVSAVGSLDQPDLDLDIFATHEPAAVSVLRKELPGQIRETASGHRHEQNKASSIQSGTSLDLNEGSTGAGGLDNVVRGTARPPISFSIESVGQNCQFTRVIRFQIQPDDVDQPARASAYGDNVEASTLYFRPQDIEQGRVCGTGLGISAVSPLRPS